MERLNDIIQRTTQRRKHAQEQLRAAQGQYAHGSPQQPQGQRPAATNQSAQPVHMQQQTPAMPHVPPTPLVQQTRQMPAHRHTQPTSEQTTGQRQQGYQGQNTQRAANPYPANYTQQVQPQRARYTSEEQARPTPQIDPQLSQTAVRPIHSAHSRQQRPIPKTPLSPLQQRQDERDAMPAHSSYYAQEQAYTSTSLYSRNERAERAEYSDYHSNPAHDYHAARSTHSARFPHPPQVADVQEGDEGEGEMLYGDWEGDDEDASPYQEIEPETYEPVSPRYPYATYTPAAPTPAVREPYAAYAPEEELAPPQARNVSDIYRSTGARRTPITHIQEVPSHQNKTQPLDHGTGTRSGTPTTPTPLHMQESSRQLIAREPLTPAPTSMQMSTKAACPKCKGAGFRRADVPFGHPNFGKPIACECKEAERKEKRRQQLIELSDLSAFHDKHFDNFNTRFPGIHSSVVEAWKEAYHFAQNPKGWLVFIGTNGCGKTHLASAIANQSLNDGMMVLFSVVPELLDHLRSAFAPTATQVYDQLFSKMREAELLVLDDLGAHYSTPWATEKLYQLLNYRYSWSMPTVITTNNVGLQSIDVRLSSRMLDSSLVTIVNLEHARDRRPYLPRRDM